MPDRVSDPASQPEFLSQDTPAAPSPGRRRPALLAGVGLAAAGAVGAGAWGFAQLSGGGPGAETVLPADVLAYVGLDLDPSAAQKIEAIKTMKKFPALAGELDLDARDDLREFLVRKFTGDGECQGFSYERDVKPWLGEKVAVAAVSSDEHLVDPVFALQVSDEDEARAGIAKVFESCGEEEFGVAFSGGYAIVAVTDELASAVAKDGRAKPLADDATYREAVDDLGDQGVVTMFVSAGAPRAVIDAYLDGYGRTFTCEASSDPEALCEGQQGAGGPDDLDEAFETFRGLAVTIRFDDGGIEVAAAGKSSKPAGETDGVPAGDLPDDTVAALGFSVPEGSFDGIVDGLRSGVGAEQYDSIVDQFRQDTGLDLPEELESLLGEGLVVALDGSTDFDAVLESEDRSVLKAGIRLGADQDDVRRMLDALLAFAGAPADQDLVKLVSDGDQVAIGFDEVYLQSLLAGGSVSLRDGRATIAEPDKATAAMFVDFDAADGWLERLVRDLAGGDRELIDNVKPLDALGLSTWATGDQWHFVARLSTD